ncbi:MAG: hypothetical protein QXT67_04725 [Candidatus Bathyarchaeia archaeon]
MSRGLILGRTYIETLILTLTEREIEAVEPDELIRIAERLEIEVCALSINMPSLKTLYANALKTLIKEIFGRDLTLPPEIFERCMIVDGLLEYLTQNPKLVLQGRYSSTDAVNKIKSIIARLAISAIHSIFYTTNMIKLEV